MRQLCLVLLLVALAAVLSGCGKPAPAPATISVSYEVRGEAGGLTKGMGEGVSAAVGKNRLEVKGGQVRANGKDYGPVKDGDAVLLDKDGQVYVNGEKRAAR